MFVILFHGNLQYKINVNQPIKTYFKKMRRRKDSIINMEPSNIDKYSVTNPKIKIDVLSIRYQQW